MRWGLAGLLLVVAVAGCSGDDDDSGSGAAADREVIPFAALGGTIPLPDPVDDVAGPDVPECTADQLTLAEIAANEVLGGTGAPSYPENHILALTAKPGERCGLSAFPTLRLVSSEGEFDPVVPQIEPMPGPEGGRLHMAGDQRPIGILRWYSSCVPADAEVTVEGQLTGGSVVSTTLDGDRPGCDPAQPNVAVPWNNFPAPPPESPLVATLEDVPNKVSVQEPLAFTVHLANPGSEPVALDPCPVYEATYGESATVTWFTNQFNCDDAPEEIPAGGELRFDVEMPLSDIPAGFPGGLFVRVYMPDGSIVMSPDEDLRTTE